MFEPHITSFSHRPVVKKLMGEMIILSSLYMFSIVLKRLKCVYIEEYSKSHLGCMMSQSRGSPGH